MGARRFYDSYHRNGIDRGLLSRDLAQITAENGMQAGMVRLPNGKFQLMVATQDAPQVMVYTLSEKDGEALMHWRSNFTNKKAYDTLISVVSQNFDVPQSYTAARNAPRYAPRAVNMVSYGYGRLTPGATGVSNGFSFREGGQIQQQASVDELLRSREQTSRQPTALVTPKGESILLSEAFSEGSEVTKRFAGAHFLDVMASHGLVIDEDKKTLKVMSQGSRGIAVYDLTDAQLAALKDNSLGGQSLKENVTDRMKIVENIIRRDFNVTADLLYEELATSKDYVNLQLTEEGRRSIERPFLEYDLQQEVAMMNERDKEINDAIEQDPTMVNGMLIGQILGEKGWFHPDSDGREMMVGVIRVLSSEQAYQEDLMNEHADKAFYEALKNQGITVQYDEESQKMTLVVERSGQQLQQYELTDSEAAALTRPAALATDGSDVHAQAAKKEIIADILARNQTVMDEQAFKEAWLNTNGQKMWQEYSAHLQQVEATYEGKFYMTAVINGQEVRKEISAKDYNKFIAINSAAQLKMADKVFDEIKIRHSDNVRDISEPFAVVDGQIIDQRLEHLREVNRDSINGEYEPQRSFRYDQKNGRAVTVGAVDVKKEEVTNALDGRRTGEHKFVMTAVINGNVKQCEINSKDYDRFLNGNDDKRWEIMAKTFHLKTEVQKEHRSGQESRMTAGVFLKNLARFVFGDFPGRDGLYWRHERYDRMMVGPGMGPARIYMKPGVTAPPPPHFFAMQQPDRGPAPTLLKTEYHREERAAATRQVAEKPDLAEQLINDIGNDFEQMDRPEQSQQQGQGIAMG